MKRSKQPPLWLRRLDAVKAEMKTVQFPKTAAEGFRQCAMLSETMQRWFLDSIRPVVITVYHPLAKRYFQQGGGTYEDRILP